MDINQTKNNPFTIFGKPSRVIVNGHEMKEDKIDDIVRWFSFDKQIKAFALSRINGVVKLYIRTTDLSCRGCTAYMPTFSVVPQPRPIECASCPRMRLRQFIALWVNREAIKGDGGVQWL